MCVCICVCGCQLEDRQPLEYLSEMRQVTIVFINLVLVEACSKISIGSTLQHAFDAIYNNIKPVQGNIIAIEN